MEETMFDNLRAFGLKELGIGLILLALALGLVTFVVFRYADVYVKVGLLDADGNPITHYGTCLYFSVVTFSTLGYGDYHPSEAAQGAAATEAMVGYVLMGLLVAMFVSLFYSVVRLLTG